jgi:hypothetical protein
MNLVISIEETRKALRVDFDFDPEELNRLAEAASSYLKRKTGYDWGKEIEIEPLAKQAVIMWVRTQFYSNSKHKKEYDFTNGLNSILVDLQLLASEKLEAEALALEEA